MTVAAPGSFDSTTGSIRTDAGDVIGGTLTRAAFLASALAAGARTLVSNEPWHSWLLERSITGRPFKLGLYFEGERLDMVVLAIDERAFGGPTWAEWSRDLEERRREAHTAWLAQFDASIGEGREYDWGRVASIYDDRSGGSEIVVRYAAQPGG
jgi:hypothetical protein